MNSKWKNVFFGVLVVFLLIAIVQQGNMLINNIQNIAITFQKDKTTKIEDTKDVSQVTKNHIEKENKKSFFTSDLLKIIMKKAIPMMELKYKVNGEEGHNNIFLSLFSMTTKINLKDPKTLLSAQIPMLESYEPDDLDITIEEQMIIYEDLAQKPMNDEEVVFNDTKPVNSKLNGQDPLVLIYHTHTTESFTSSSKTNIDYISPWRSLDESKNVCRIGKEMQGILEDQYGIGVLHNTTLHDYPDYNGSYTRSLQTIEKILKDNPSIKYVFDIHRDGFKDTKKNRDNNVTVFGEQKIAKVSLVVGNDNFNSDQNKSFAQKIKKVLDNEYPGITKETSIRDNRKYNQFVSDYAVLFEVGSNLSTLEEALEASKPIANVLGELITELEQ